MKTILDQHREAIEKDGHWSKDQNNYLAAVTCEKITLDERERFAKEVIEWIGISGFEYRVNHWDDSDGDKIYTTSELLSLYLTHLASQAKKS